MKPFSPELTTLFTSTDLKDVSLALDLMSEEQLSAIMTRVLEMGEEGDPRLDPDLMLRLRECLGDM